MDDNKQELLDELDRARGYLKSVLARVDQQVDIYPTWKLKQVLDHVAGWDDAVLASIRSHALGQTPIVTAPRGIDYYNAETVTTREAILLEQSWKEFDVTRQRLKQAILDLPPEKMDLPFVSPWGDKGTVSWLVEIFVDHELSHAYEIEEKLG